MIAGVPLGLPYTRCNTLTVNILGSGQKRDIMSTIPSELMERAHFHFYNKSDWRSGRKVGHLTLTAAHDRQDLIAIYEQFRPYLEGTNA
jgi:phosphoribosylaminoimidazole carboxylase (NCAIR synthetase)